MNSLAKLHSTHQPFHLSLNPHPPFPTKPISSLSFSTPPKLPCTRASLNHTPQPLHPLKTLSISLAAAAALTVFLTKFSSPPAIASPIAPPVPAEAEPAAQTETSFSDEEKALEEKVAENPNDVEALTLLMEVRMKSRKLVEAIDVVDRLIVLEPNDDELPLLKAHLYSYSGDVETAVKLFEEMIKKDPLRVDAYHGLVMANSEAGASISGILKRIELAMEKCKKEKKMSAVRDFKLLLAQVRVLEENYGHALKVYEELEKEEPSDFRPYFGQGIIYTSLMQKEEAEEKFEQFWKLVPKDHPCREYFLDNISGTKFSSEKVEREKA